jgi:hypothetical protein
MLRFAGQLRSGSPAGFPPRAYSDLKSARSRYRLLRICRSGKARACNPLDTAPAEIATCWGWRGDGDRGGQKSITV